MCQNIFLIACLCGISIAYVSAYPYPANNQELDVLQIPLTNGKEIDVLTLGNKDQEQAIAERNKRTIGLLRELFPEITKQIDGIVNRIIAQVIRVAGPSLLPALLGNNRPTTKRPANSDEDDSDFDDVEENDNNGGNGINSMSTRVEIELPTFAPGSNVSATTSTDSNEIRNVSEGMANMQSTTITINMLINSTPKTTASYETTENKNTLLPEIMTETVTSTNIEESEKKTTQTITLTKLPSATFRVTSTATSTETSTPTSTPTSTETPTTIPVTTELLRSTMTTTQQIELPATETSVTASSSPIDATKATTEGLLMTVTELQPLDTTLETLIRTTTTTETTTNARGLPILASATSLSSAAAIDTPATTTTTRTTTTDILTTPITEVATSDNDESQIVAIIHDLNRLLNRTNYFITTRDKLTTTSSTPPSSAATAITTMTNTPPTAALSPSITSPSTIHTIDNNLATTTIKITKLHPVNDQNFRND